MRIPFGQAFAATLAFMVALPVAAAKTGDRWNNAGSISVGKSKTVTLVPERDDDGETWDSGVYYLSFTCSRFQAYTVYTSGLNDESGVDMSVDDITSYKDYGDKDPPWLPSFSGSTDRDGNIRSILYADDWDEDYAKSGTYFIVLTGEIGTDVTVTVAKGAIEEQVQYGLEENPAPLSVGVNQSSKSGTLIGGQYYFSASLTAGKKYSFWTTGGNDDSPLKLDVDGDSEAEIDTPETRPMSGLDGNNEGLIVVPVKTGKHIIVVDGYGNGKFSLNYGETPARTPVNHPSVALATPAIHNSVSATFNPGHRNDPNSGFFDQVIDQQLFNVNLKKDTFYAFSAVGDGQTKLTMELYEANSFVSVLKTTAVDPMLVYKPAKDAVYYVGVCEALEDDETDEPKGISATLAVCAAVKGDGLMDAWDPMDDTAGEACGLAPRPGVKTDDVVAKGDAHGPHTFGMTDWADTYQVAARKGLTYRLKSSLSVDDENFVQDSTNWTLKATVYTLSGTAKKAVTTIDNLSEGGEFTASAHGTYFVEVSVDGGQGRDYGPYVLHSLACDPNGSTLGSLQVEIGGASYSEGATWSLTSDGNSAPKYPGGSSVLLPVGSYTVKFAAVKNWTTPADVSVTVKESGTNPVSVKYSDANDDAVNDAANGDGSKSGKKVTTLKPAKAEATVARSLWASDEADWYKFTLTPNGSYRFAFKESAKLGDAEIVVYRENGKDVVARGTEASFLCRETKGTYYVCVCHGASTPADSQYVMAHSMKQVGAVGFAKAAVSVKDNATSVALTVNRSTGKEGRVRVRYTTISETAIPGTHYIPQSGYLEWSDGDTKPKTLTIGLIGDLKAKWEADRTFKVELAVVSTSSLEGDEYVPMLGVSSAEVTIQEATKMVTGQVAFSAWGDADDDFANAAKPAISCAAGDTVRLRLSRTGGSDGRIGVTVAPTKGTAVADTHFDAAVQTVTWEDGDDADKYVEISTYPGADEFFTPKAFTVKLTADKTAGYAPSKVGAAVTVTLGDSDVAQSLADYIADEKAKGVAVKAGKADTWYVDALGRLRSTEVAAGGSVSLTYTFKDHGKLAFLPTVVKDADDVKSTVICKIDKETVALEDGVEVVRYLGKGSHTVAFTVTRDKTSKSAEVYLALAPQLDGSAGIWKPLPLPGRIAPLAPEVAIGQYDMVTFAWSDANDPEIVYLFSLDKDAKKVGTANAKFYGSAENYLEYAETLVQVYCPSCVTQEPGDGIVAGSTYSWRVDSAFIADGAIKLINTNAVWTVVSAVAEVGELAPRPFLTGTDAAGNSFSAGDGFGVPVEVTLVQGLSTSLSFGGVNTAAGSTLTYALAKGSAALPVGLSLKDGKLTGVPSKAVTTTNVVQITQKATENNKSTTTVGATVTLIISVKPMNYAEGTFNGLAVTEDNRFSATSDGRIGSLTFTAASSGKLSAKAIVGGTTYSFAGPSWTESMTFDNGLPGLKARLEQVSKTTIGRTTVVYTNVLEVTACRGETNDWDVIDTPLTGTLTLNLLSADKKTIIPNVSYAVEAVRDFAKVKPVAAETAAFAGYYTMSLPATDAEAGTPLGHGYLTMTVSATGVAKSAAVLADQTKVSLSVTGAYVSRNDDGLPAFRVPLYYGKSPVSFGGWLVVKLADDGTPFVDSSSRLTWINGTAASTYGGTAGFAQTLEPTGGYYDTVMNLQTYYLDYAFRVEAIGLDDLPKELLGANAAYVAYPGMFPEYLTLLGNAITASKQVKVMRKDNKQLVDWASTVNPANTDIKFTRATGLYTGSFDLYAGNGASGTETKQVKLGSMKAQGVLLLSRDKDAALKFEDGVMPGFYIVPVKLDRRTWNASLPFQIVPNAVDNDWSEGLPD